MACSRIGLRRGAFVLGGTDALVPKKRLSLAVNKLTTFSCGSFSRYFGFDAGDPIYDGADAAKHLGREFVESAIEVSNRGARAREGKSSVWGTRLVILWHAPVQFQLSTPEARWCQVASGPLRGR